MIWFDYIFLPGQYARYAAEEIVLELNIEFSVSANLKRLSVIAYFASTLLSSIATGLALDGDTNWSSLCMWTMLISASSSSSLFLRSFRRSQQCSSFFSPSLFMHFPLTDKLCTRRHCLKIKCYLNPVKFRNAIVYHRGDVDKVRDNTDVELDFRQESNFFYLTGTSLMLYTVSSPNI